MWVRKRIDISWRDIAVGLGYCVTPTNRQRAIDDLESAWSDSNEAFVCLSVRSGFDLLLETLDWAPRSEVILTAMTIPDMARIVREHQLDPVPVDLDMTSVSPLASQIEASITPKTRAIVVAHLFGGTIDMDPIVELARRHNLMLIEDCAQAFVGMEHTGHAGCDVSMFSFGPIKTNTALGGAMFTLRDPQLRDRIRDAHKQWPCQSRGAFSRRLLKYAFVRAISMRWIAGTVAKACRLVGTDHEGIATRMARGFAGPNFFRRIRKQPSTPLIRLLDRRLRNFRTTEINDRIARGHFLAEQLGDAIPCLGAMSVHPTYWVYPIVVDDPDRMVRQLWRHGFDATYHSSLTVVAPEDAEQHPLAGHCQSVLDKTVFLPFSRRMPFPELQRMAEVVLAENPSTDIELRLATRPSTPQPHWIERNSKRVPNEV